MAKGIYSLLPKHYAMRLSDHHGCQMAIARFFRIVQGDHSSCLKPPVDFNLITRHVNSGEYFVSFSNLGLGSDHRGQTEEFSLQSASLALVVCKQSLVPFIRNFVNDPNKTSHLRHYSGIVS